VTLDPFRFDCFTDRATGEPVVDVAGAVFDQIGGWYR
jgi:hypothetical protein